MHTRSIWRALNQVLDASPVKSHPTLRNCLLQTYESTVCSAIRREADTDDRTTSLARAIRRLDEAPQAITREKFLRLFRDSHPDAELSEGVRAFSRFAHDGGDRLDRKVLRANSDRLIAAASSVKQYTDKFIAHRERPSEAAISLNFAQIDHVLNELAEVTKFLHGIRHPGDMLWQVIPVMDLSFLAMFQSTWIHEGFVLSEEPELARSRD